MGQSLIPVLLLATVALSSSNVLPLSLNHLNRELLGLDSQYNDNTYSNRYQTRNVLDEIYKLYITSNNKSTLSKMQQMYADKDNNRDDDILSMFNKIDKYDAELVRKEQWHNYPRQLDRLHQYSEQNDVKRTLDTDPSKERYPEEIAPDSHDITNEFPQGSNTGTHNIYDAVISVNPLLILKLRLACLSKDNDNTNTQYANMMTSERESNYLREGEQLRDEIPEVNAIKVKREGVLSIEENNELSDNPSSENKAVSKRIFSLFSRLQSLNPKAHALQHRRHLHAIYGLPDSDGGGMLTAETRATLLRPPGIPLRWG